MEKKKIDLIIDQGFKLGMSQIREEIVKLSEIILKIRPVNMLEIGSKLGGNLFVLSELCVGKKISVDIVGGEHGGWILQEHPYLGNIPTLRNRYFSDLYDINMILGDSHNKKTLNKVKQILGKEKLGLLYIDGDHTFKGVKMDFEMYSPLLSQSGIIILHDIVKSEFHLKHDNQVARFWDTLKGQKTEIKSGEHWGGIGIWYR